MHHHCIHAVGHGEGLQVALDGDGKGQLVNEVDGCAGDNRAAAEVLQAEHCGEAEKAHGQVKSALSLTRDSSKAINKKCHFKILTG